MGYRDEELEEQFLEEEEDFDGEEEIRELEVDDNGRIRRGPVVNPDEDYFEEGDEEVERNSFGNPAYGGPQDED